MALRASRLAVVLSLFSVTGGCSSEQDATPGEESQDVTSESPASAAVPKVDGVKITILSDMVVSSGTVAEWGFSAFVEVKTGAVTKSFLFDTGASEQVIRNATELGVDICAAEDVVLSHNHGDHTMGLVAIRTHCKTKNPKAAIRAHVGGPEMFWPRLTRTGEDDNVMTAERAKYEAAGGTFVTNEAGGPFAGIPGVYLTGKIARSRNEGVHPADPPITTPTGDRVEDTVPEEQALAINTKQGLVVVTGCGHAGLTNTLEAAQARTGRTKMFGLVGGLHLLNKPLGSESEVGTMLWEAAQLKRMTPKHILGAHCTGFERILFLRKELKIRDADALISTIGSQLTETGIVPANLNKPVP
jgi:7,8-dihydropterin-6-yl-methyl-4-(beta-D-ribofuranosyl)aminobenzene 5'-phosphate synthase